MKRRLDSGSTLIELLISITIVGMILVIIMGAFRIGIRAWETGERDIESFQRQQIVLSMLKRQLSSAVLQPIEIEDNRPFVFSGDEAILDFISGVSLIPGDDFGNVRVTYRISRKHETDQYLLEIAERNFLTGGLDQAIDALDQDMIYELIGSAYDIRFEYLKETVPGEAFDWQPRWDEATDTGLPVAVRCVLQMDEKKPPATMVARILFREDLS